MDLSIDLLAKTQNGMNKKSQSPELTIEDILGNDDILNEFKYNSFSLLNISSIINPDIFRNIVSFIIHEFSDDDIQRRVNEINDKHPELACETLFENFKFIYRNKFPYNASEILSMDIPQITKMFFYKELTYKDEDIFEELDESSVKNIEEDIFLTPNSTEKNNEFKEKYEMLDYFFSFLESDEELNVVLCGYFLKVFNRLAISKNVQVLIKE